ARWAWARRSALHCRSATVSEQAEDREGDWPDDSFLATSAGARGEPLRTVGSPKHKAPFARRGPGRLILGALIFLALDVAFVPIAWAQSQMTWALPVSLVPAWFDPGEISPVQTSLVVMSALHDALVKPMPGQPLGPSLAESWQVSKDGLVYEFTLRSGVLFHNGERVTADDVKFSFDRSRAPSRKILKERMAAVDVVDPLHIRFRLKAPWSDFMSAYATPLTKAAWIVPKKYIEKVGDDGFKKAPVGAGPYRFVSYTPGVELVLEAHDRYWRKKPSVNRLALRGVPGGDTQRAR